GFSGLGRGADLGRRLPRCEYAAIDVAEVHLAPRSCDEQAPARGADHQCDRVSRSIGVGLPARPHLVESAATIEFDRLRAEITTRQRATFAQSQHRLAANRERKLAVLVEDQLLNGAIVRAGYDHAQWVGKDLDVQAADFGFDRVFDFAKTDDRWTVVASE